MVWTTLLLAQFVSMSAEDVLRLKQILFGGLLLVVLPVVFCLLPILIWRGRLRRQGYPGLRAYLRELPRTDEEKLDAVELTLKGSMLCLLGLLWPPIIIIGLVPLYFGVRKLAAVKLGIKSLEQDQPTGKSL
jgi:hypothetical protein